MKNVFAGIFLFAIISGCGPNTADVNTNINNSGAVTDSIPDSLKAAADSGNARVQRSIDSLDTHIEEIFERKDSL